MNKILVLAVHPDDETLGCGGTLLKHKANGDHIHWLIATNATDKYRSNEQELLRLELEIKKVSQMYKFDGIYELGLPTAKVDEFPLNKIIEKIAAVINKVQPNVIYLPFANDVHSDHRIIFEAAYTCIKTFRSPFIKKILMMETISETEFAAPQRDFTFIPNYFVDISGFLDSKLDIMKIFTKELGQHPFPRSLENIRALATFRGATAGCMYAESFMLLKEIQ